VACCVTTGVAKCAALHASQYDYDTMSIVLS